MSFEYPSGISVSYDSITLRYPSGISIGTANKSVTIPATPKFNMKDYSFNVPDKLEITHRELMKDEKALLEKTSTQLNSINDSLKKTSKSLSGIKDLIEKDIQGSLNETDRNLLDAEEKLKLFVTERVPGVLEQLSMQREGVHHSRGIFSATSGLIPLMFAIFGLITVGIAANGGMRLFAKRETVA